MVKNLTVNVLRNFDIDKKLVHKIIMLLSKELKFELDSIQINFVNSKEIMRINKEYLNHNFSTDIITFGYSKSKKNLDGEIYISVDDAASNAKKYGVSLQKEIKRLIIHGFLHLLGYNDQSRKEKEIMKKLENKLLNKYGLVK